MLNGVISNGERLTRPHRARCTKLYLDVDGLWCLGTSRP